MSVVNSRLTTFTLGVALRAVAEKILATGCQVGRRMSGFFRKIPVSTIDLSCPSCAGAKHAHAGKRR
jgi:hypothetical protein